MKHIALITSLLVMSSTALCAQQAASPNEDTTALISPGGANDTEVEENADPSAIYTIFSNLGAKEDPYNSDGFLGKPIIGKQVSQMTERWDAVRFVPKVDVQASVLEAAVQYVAGTRLVRLGIYASDGFFGYPGTLLPGAQGSTADIPDRGECCQVAKVVLVQPVTLTANTIYWLVASSDDAYGPDFNGIWQVSHLGERAVLLHPYPSWILTSGDWPAARIRGTKLRALGPVDEQEQTNASMLSGASTAWTKIFSNLNRVYPQPYVAGVGVPVIGNNVSGYGETWEAIPFTPKRDVRAKILKAALAHAISLQPIINLGIYTDDSGLPGSPLAGGQGTGTDVPLSGECCDFAAVRLPATGVALTAGVQYWLVASPNNEAENFMGIWQPSTNAIWARLYPEQGSLWSGFNGDWLAAQIAGVGN